MGKTLDMPYVLRWQRMLTLDFTETIRPYIIPYQMVAFWAGRWRQDPGNNVDTFRTLQLRTIGVTFEYSDLTIELFAITRERLLQQGTTNLTTFDFENGESMYTTLADRDYDTFTVSSLHDAAPDYVRAIV